MAGHGGITAASGAAARFSTPPMRLKGREQQCARLHVARRLCH